MSGAHEEGGINRHRGAHGSQILKSTAGNTTAEAQSGKTRRGRFLWWYMHAHRLIDGDETLVLIVQERVGPRGLQRHEALPKQAGVASEVPEYHHDHKHLERDSPQEP